MPKPLKPVRSAPISAPFALVEAPIMEGLGEVLGKISIGQNLSDLIKLVPFGQTLGKLFKRADPDKDTDQQVREDNKHVLKVRDANKIIDEELTGFFGKLYEFADALNATGLNQKPAGITDMPTLVKRIKARIRKAALTQNNPRVRETKTIDTRRP